MNKMEILDECYELSLSDKLALRDDLNMIIEDYIKQLKIDFKALEIQYWNEVQKTKNLGDTLSDRLEEIKELKKNG